jgi:hypothetical protein
VKDVSKKSLAELGRDDRGQMAPELLGFLFIFFIVAFIFLMNVQLAQLFHCRDVVDHAGALAADSAKKTYCAKQGSSEAAVQEAKKSMRVVMDTAGGSEKCDVSVSAKGQSSDPGAKELDVKIDCKFDCRIPVAAQILCHDKHGSISMKAQLKTAALGCDGKGTGS